jgi:hypothetical protein
VEACVSLWRDFGERGLANWCQEESDEA